MSGVLLLAWHVGVAASAPPQVCTSLPFDENWVCCAERKVDWFYEQLVRFDAPTLLACGKALQAQCRDLNAVVEMREQRAHDVYTTRLLTAVHGLACRQGVQEDWSERGARFPTHHEPEALPLPPHLVAHGLSDGLAVALNAAIIVQYIQAMHLRAEKPKVFRVLDDWATWGTRQAVLLNPFDRRIRCLAELRAAEQIAPAENDWPPSCVFDDPLPLGPSRMARSRAERLEEALHAILNYEG